jgi:hypothetical protein
LGTEWSSGDVHGVGFVVLLYIRLNIDCAHTLLKDRWSLT